jgi:hypothetical protein
VLKTYEKSKVNQFLALLFLFTRRYPTDKETGLSDMLSKAHGAPRALYLAIPIIISVELVWET